MELLMRPLQNYTQKEALLTAIEFVTALYGSTNNKEAKNDLDSARTLLERVMLIHVQGDGIPEYDNILLMTVTNRKVLV
jgi:hypothetical protein